MKCVVIKNSLYMKSKAIAIICLMGMALQNGARADSKKKTTSLVDIWTMAEKHSPGLKARLKQIEAIQYSIDALPRAFVPDTSVDAGYSFAMNKDSFEHGPLARLRAQWTLWDGGRKKYLKLSEQYRAKSTKYQQKMLLIELKKTVAALYYHVSYLREIHSVDLERNKHLQRLTSLLWPRLKIGKVGYSDIQHVKLEIAKYESKMRMQKKLLHLKEEQLALLTGKDSQQNAIAVQAISKMKPVADFATTKKIHFTTLPAYRFGKLHSKSLQARKELANRELYWPSFGVEMYGGYGPHLDAIHPRKPEIGMALRFSLPLFMSRDRKSELLSQKARIDALQLDMQQFLRDARLDYRQKQEKIALYNSRIIDLQKIVKDSQKTIARAYTEFARGLKSSADMLALIQYVYDCKNEYITLKMKWLNIHAENYLLYINSKELQ